jgi:hypothetical protein
MLALWSCGRRAGVVQAQRQIHRALRTAFTIAETVVVRTIADQPALAVPRGHTSIGRHGSKYHSVCGFSVATPSPTLQCSQLPVGVAAGALSLQPFQQLARCVPRLCLKPSAGSGRRLNRLGFAFAMMVGRTSPSFHAVRKPERNRLQCR